MKKRILSLLMALALSFSMTPTVAFAEKLELPRRIRSCACGMARRKFFITVSAALKKYQSI